MTDPLLVQRARMLAHQAHASQTDKNGQPYIGHVERVAARLNDPEDVVVALLHDVVEDTDVALDYLAEGFPADVVADVDRLTHRPHEPRIDYYARVVESERARRVKLADVADNSDPARLAHLDEATRDRLTAKYETARRMLGDPARSDT